jgi:DNA-binding HxlR family transcriptional regulator
MRPAEISVARRERTLRQLAAAGLVERDDRDDEKWRLTEMGREALAALWALSILEHADAIDAERPAPPIH